MKLSSILTQYLYENKQLNIPGIGQFTIDKTVTIPEQTDKNFQEFLQYIQFTSKNVLRPDDSLIDFIRVKTGKIKPLAESDLESYLADCKLLLNIGKPLYLEGIGTLQKNKDGQFDFMHGQAMSERMESLPPEKNVEKQGERRFLYNNEYTSQSGQSNTLRKVLIMAGIIMGLGVIIWGGYLLYSQKSNPDNDTQEQTRNLPADTTGVPASTADSLITTSLVNDTLPVKKIADTNLPSIGTYKFICEETYTRQRALSRFQTLQKFNTKYQMETKDSVHFSIYVILPASPADTTKIKDSLKLWYWGARNRSIRIAQQ